MRLFIRQHQCPGDILMLTAAVRDLKRAFPSWEVGVETTAQELWDNNPYINRRVTPSFADAVVKAEYPLIHESNDSPLHFVNAFRMFLERRLCVRIPQGPPRCDLHLSDGEREMFAGLPPNTWLVDAGYKDDFTAKYWSFDRFQRVIDATRDRINWVQIGAKEHNHRLLRNVTGMIGRTTHRQLMALMYQADGVLTPVSYPMHLATMEWRRGRLRPCVVLGGGREPSQWYGYGWHQVLHCCGAMDRNPNGGCWRSRTVPLGDGSDGDRSLCAHPVDEGGETLPLCMARITPEDVVRRIETCLRESR